MSFKQLDPIADTETLGRHGSVPHNSEPFKQLDPIADTETHAKNAPLKAHENTFKQLDPIADTETRLETAGSDIQQVIPSNNSIRLRILKL